MKIKNRYRLKLAFFISILLLNISCSENSSSFPPVKLEFLTAMTNNDGEITSINNDNNETFGVLENKSTTKLPISSEQRIVAYYEEVGSNVILHSVLKPFVQLPIITNENYPTDEISVQSIWIKNDYLNGVFLIKAQNKKHHFAFIELKKEISTDGVHKVCLAFSHDQSDDLMAYTQKLYFSIPLTHYKDFLGDAGVVQIKINTFDEGFKLYNINYLAD